MLKKRIKYTDYDGNVREEDFYFNLSKAELTEMELSTLGGMEKRINRIVSAQDTKQIVEVFKDIILRSYGEKSLDGKRFIKSPELATEFSQTEAYTELFMELATDDNAAAAFLTGIIPSEVAAQVEKEMKEQNIFVPATNS